MLTIRLADVGPIGVVRASPPLTLASLRKLIVEQIGDRLPNAGFSFLVGGATVSAAQECSEELYKDGDVFIVGHPAFGKSGTRQLSLNPSVSLVKQFVDAFGFMCVLH